MKGGGYSSFDDSFRPGPFVSVSSGTCGWKSFFVSYSARAWLFQRSQSHTGRKRQESRGYVAPFASERRVGRQEITHSHLSRSCDLPADLCHDPSRGDMLIVVPQTNAIKSLRTGRIPPLTEQEPTVTLALDYGYMLLPVPARGECVLDFERRCCVRRGPGVTGGWGLSTWV